MIENILDNIKALGLEKDLRESLIGVEVEEHRLLESGTLSKYPYPTELGSRLFHPYLQSDFAESQNEIISDAHSRVHNTAVQLNAIQNVLCDHLKKDEVIWPLSMPPILSASDIKFIDDNFYRPAYAKYRDYLTDKYGIPKKIITGVHINFSVSKPFLESLFSAYQPEYSDFTAFKNDFYFQLIQNFVLHRYVLTYLFGASPIFEQGFLTHKSELTHPVRSIRNSSLGYVNNPEDKVNVGVYSSMDHLISALEDAIETHRLYSPAEFYGPVRMRGQNHFTEYPKKGINYLEFRVFDNDPFDANGVSAETMAFVKKWLAYLITLPVNESTISADLKQSFSYNDKVALEDPNSHSALEERMRAIFEDFLQTGTKLGFDSRELALINKMNDRVANPASTPAAKLASHIKNDSLVEYATKLAKQHKQLRKEKNIDRFGLPANVQSFIKNCIRDGVSYQILEDSQLGLKYQDKKLVVKYEDLTPTIVLEPVKLF
ncbi:gamma-glutamylcysteine synthetase [Lentilactobacillus sp. Marseille-Q4993]|uniref:gamma-glutamylcysteine synthetase n=1 Tax=Lentilactobacillus sp. Marseille-Q4993 TaxID=3039492 RepID=UPI0024BC7839|nr:gamma-glutamylcysteine synthetase [Lentilactobacillus sp. Marseille-Q4993]